MGELIPYILGILILMLYPVMLFLMVKKTWRYCKLFPEKKKSILLLGILLYIFSRVFFGYSNIWPGEISGAILGAISVALSGILILVFINIKNKKVEYFGYVLCVTWIITLFSAIISG